MWRRLVLAIALVMLSPAAWAQSNPTMTEAERGIRRGFDKPAARLRINALDVRAHLVGHTADIAIEMLIGSDDRDSHEANLVLTLPAGAVVTGYALDLGGAMIPGVLLEAPKARNVYEDEVRAGIDPGLAEVAGNRLTTRIFPIDALHSRRFRVTFVAAFDPSVGLVLPLARDAAIGRVAVSITADGYAKEPAIRFAGRPLALTQNGGRFRGDAVLSQAVLREGLTVTGGTPTGPMLVTRHPGGRSFFVIDDGVTGERAPPTRGGRLRVYWDRSLSHRADRVDLEAEVLARLAERTSPDAIDLVTFASDRPQVTTVTGAASLREALARVSYRGGTSLAGLDALALPAAARCVLVTDGVVTIDRGATFAPECRVMALTASPGGDGARLALLTQRTGGTVVRLNAGAEAEGVAALANPAAAPLSVHDTAGRQISTRMLQTSSGRWLLVGPTLAGGITVRLSDGRERHYTPAGTPIAAEVLGALWAASRVVELADDPARHAEMAETARVYQVAGPGMSFLVLETPDQYLHADLTPPRDFGEYWWTQYRDAKRDWDQEHSTAREKRLSLVLDQWRERRAWWSMHFTPLTQVQPKHRFDRDSRNAPPPPPPLPQVSAPSPTTPMPAVPALVAAAPAEPAGDIVVTNARAEGLSRTPRNEPPAAIKLDLADLSAKHPYMTALEVAGLAGRLAVLADQEQQYGSVPAFYLDTAEWFRLKGDSATAALLLLSALELPTSDDETRQIVAFRLERDHSFDRAVELAELLAAANAAFRPQPGRDLALTLAARGQAAGKAGRVDLERAFQLLVDTALNPASADFDGVEVIALMEANALIPKIAAVNGHWTLDPRLVGLTDTDARIVIEWTADDADIDLWVDEPNGERVIYSNKRSSAGGQISNDMTDGYGPEEYAIHRAPAGAYRVRVNGYDADRINPNGPGHVLIRLQHDFARSHQIETLVDLDLSFQAGKNRNETRPVATLRVAR